MSNFNKVILVGNLTRDITLSYLPSQTPVADGGIAVSRKWTTKEGESKEEVLFIDFRAFSRSAENLNKYTAQGHSILLEGRLSYEQWDGKDGQKHNRHRVIVDSFQFLQSKPKGDEQAGPEVQQAETEPARDDF